MFRRRVEKDCADRSTNDSEQRFVDRLVVDGNESEVQLAMEKLQDENLFFEYQTPRHRKHHNTTNTTNTAGTNEEERETVGSPRPSLDRQCSTGGHRRLQILEQRKQSTTMSQMWKAHETGLAVTQSASKRSFLYQREVSYHCSQVNQKNVVTECFECPILPLAFPWAWQGMHSCCGN